MRAEFDIIGRIGKVNKFDGTTRISIATNYRRKEADGKWVDDPHWNEVVVFSDKTRKYIDEHLDSGDKISVRGRIRNGSYEKDGKTVYTTDLIVRELHLMARKLEADKHPETDQGE